MDGDLSAVVTLPETPFVVDSAPMNDDAQSGSDERAGDSTRPRRERPSRKAASPGADAGSKPQSRRSRATKQNDMLVPDSPPISMPDDSAETPIETDSTIDDPHAIVPDVDESAADSAPGVPDNAADEITPQHVVEAILFSADSPLPPAKIAAVLGIGDARDVRRHITTLNEAYASQGRAFRIEQIAGGYQMMTLPAYNAWLAKLLRARQETKLTPAAMETLAIVAYKQPCTRADVEAIRGVAVGDVINRLREMNLVKIVGRAEDLGRPMLYGTTKRFLEVFGLPSLEDLPPVEAFGMSSPGQGKSQPPETETALTPETQEDVLE